MRDVEDQARALLQGARRTAERLLVEAQRAGDEIRNRARDEGMAEGMDAGLNRGLEEGRAKGRQEALDEHRTQLTEALTALTAATQSLDAARDDLESAALREVVELSVAVARRVTKRQGVIDPGVLTENLREAMRLVVKASDVTVAFHPSQRQALEAALPALKLEFPELQHVELVDDGTLAPGGCRITAGQGQVDADLEVQLDRIAADLLPTQDEDSPEVYPLTRVKKAKKTEERG